jgi:hypothetical protein
MGVNSLLPPVVEGWNVVRLIESYGCNSGNPAANVRIVGAGVLENESESAN